MKMTFKVTQGQLESAIIQQAVYHFQPCQWFGAANSNVCILHCFQDITTFTTYVTVCDL